MSYYLQTSYQQMRKQWFVLQKVETLDTGRPILWRCFVKKSIFDKMTTFCDGEGFVVLSIRSER